MQLQFTQLNLIEGFKPRCLQVTVHYNLENDLQQYLWPVRVVAKARSTSCNEPLKDATFYPIKNSGFLISTEALNMLVCVSGCVFHFIRLLTYCAVGKVCNHERI